jgi:hypothetical protein
MKTILIALLLASSAFAEQRTASIFDIGKTKEAARFNQVTVLEELGTGNKSWNTKVTDPKGQVVMTEVATMKDDRVVYQYVEYPLQNESFELSVDGDKATYNVYALVNGKKEKPKDSRTFKLDDNFIIGPMTEPYLIKNWNALMEGKTIEVEFGAFELQKAVSFEFKKLKVTDKTVEVEMKPSSFFIAKVVGPILMEFDKEKKRVIRFLGRTTLREQVNGRWKPYEAEILYH